MDPKVSAIVTVEEHTRIGGLGSAILEYCNDLMPSESEKSGELVCRIDFQKSMGARNLY